MLLLLMRSGLPKYLMKWKQKKMPLFLQPELLLVPGTRGIAHSLWDGALFAVGVWLCRELHPTPAVGGCPTDTAVQRIRDWEGFDRGWYAAPFGVIGRDVVELAVAIRSACVKEKRLSLFSGAGIVSGSTPDQEWDEIENKIVDFIRILTASV